MQWDNLRVTRLRTASIYTNPSCEHMPMATIAQEACPEQKPEHWVGLRSLMSACLGSSTFHVGSYRTRCFEEGGRKGVRRVLFQELTNGVSSAKACSRATVRHRRFAGSSLPARPKSDRLTKHRSSRDWKSTAWPGLGVLIWKMSGLSRCG
ncbi:hypothetical protein PLICRDRAFT_295436 [Plicaturopsis crispa FD-325 SS-3]|nr:hypothetical protein PLICRDRAFT_295436 [Plicaturopsis crispa FD-325 SS-3]